MSRRELNIPNGGKEINGMLFNNGSTEPKNATFVIEKYIGSGGSGFVYLASYNGKKYAIKELYPKELDIVLNRSQDGTIVLNELASKRHRDVLDWYIKNLQFEIKTMYNVGKSDFGFNNDPKTLLSYGYLKVNESTYYAIYDSFEGRSLYDYIKQYESDKSGISASEYLKKSLDIMAIIAKKLEVIHRKGFLHLDITPANLYLVDHGYGCVDKLRDEIPYIIDFGSSYNLNDEGKIHRFSTSEGYSAAELYGVAQSISSYNVDVTADTFSLAAVLFRILFGTTYDWVDKEEWAECIAIYPQITQKKLFKIFEKGLNPNKKERFESADSFANELLKVSDSISEGTDAFKGYVSSLSQEIESIKHRLGYVEEVIKPQTENGQEDALFRYIDCLLSIEVPDHKAINSKKNIPLTYPAFVSMFKFSGVNGQMNLVASQHIEQYLPGKEHFLNSEEMCEQLSRLIAVNCNKNSVLARFSLEYELFFNGKNNFDNGTDLICVRKKNNVGNNRFFTTEETIEAIDYLYNAYLKETGDDLLSQYKKALNYSVSYAVASLVWNGLVFDKKLFFEKVSYLVKTHNHKTDYILALIEKKWQNSDKFHFDPNDDYYWEQVNKLIANYYDDVHNTDFSNLDFGTKYLQWMNNRTIKEKSLSDKCYELISYHNCFDPRIWEKRFESSLNNASNLRTYVMKEIFENGTENQRFGFLLLFGRSGKLGKHLIISHAKDYNDAFFEYINRAVDELSRSITSKSNSNSVIKTQSKAILHAMARVLLFLNSATETRSKVVELTNKLYESCCDNHGNRNVIKKAYSYIVEGSIDNFKMMSLDDVCAILSGIVSSKNSNAEFDDSFSLAIDLLKNNNMKIKINDGNSNENVETYNESYSYFMETVFNLIKSEELPLAAVQLLLCFNKKISDNSTKEKWLKLFNLVIPKIEVYKKYGRYGIVSCHDVEIIINSFLYVNNNCRTPVFNNFVKQAFIKMPIVKDKCSAPYHLIGKIFDNSLLDIDEVISEIKNINNSNYQYVLKSLLFSKWYGYERIYISDLIRKMLIPETFFLLPNDIQDNLIFFTLKKKEYGCQLNELLNALIEFRQQSSDNSYNNYDKLIFLLLSSTNEAPPEITSLIVDLSERLKVDFEKGWHDFGVGKKRHFGYTEHLISCFYESNRYAMQIIAARALSIGIGNILYEIKNSRESDERNYIITRLESVPFFLQLPFLKNISSIYADELVDELDKENNDFVIRTERGDETLRDLIDTYCGNSASVKKTAVLLEDISTDEVPKYDMPSDQRRMELNKSLTERLRQQKNSEEIILLDYGTIILWRDKDKYQVIDGYKILYYLKNKVSGVRVPEYVNAIVFEPEVNISLNSVSNERNNEAKKTFEELNERLVNSLRSSFPDDAVNFKTDNCDNVLKISFKKDFEKYDIIKSKCNYLFSFYNNYRQPWFRKKIMKQPENEHCLDNMRNMYDSVIQKIARINQ